jgi:hypothetical protein
MIALVIFARFGNQGQVQNLFFFQNQRLPSDPASAFFVPLLQGANMTFREQEVVITRHGRPAGVLIGFDSEEDWLEYRLEHNPEFLNRRKFRGELLDAGWLTLTSEGNLDSGAYWENPMRLLSTPGYVFPGGGGGLFVARIEDPWTRLSVGKVWLKGEEVRAQPTIALSNSPPNVREPLSPSLSSVQESETGDVLVAGRFTHAAVEGPEHRALGLALVRGGKLDVEFLDRVGRDSSRGREVLDARILSSGEIVFVGRSPFEDGRGESFTISRLSPSGAALRTCQATFPRN